MMFNHTGSIGIELLYLVREYEAGLWTGNRCYKGIKRQECKIYSARTGERKESLSKKVQNASLCTEAKHVKRRKISKLPKREEEKVY